MDLHNLSDHGETQACTENIPGAAGAVRPVKAFKNTGLVFRADSDPVIGNREDRFFVSGLEPDKDISLFFSVFTGVVDEILQGAFQQKPVPADSHVGLYFRGQCHVPGGDQRHIADSGIRKFREVKICQRVVFGAHFHPGVVQHGGNESLHPSALTQNH